jgi:hypothetical protein
MQVSLLEMIGRTENFVPVLAIEFSYYYALLLKVQEKNRVGMAVCPHISSREPQDRFFIKKVGDASARGGV